MSSVSLKGVWEAIWGLLVEDGSLAIGIVLALAVTWIAAIVVPEAMRDQIGWLLLVMLALLVGFNIHAAGRKVRSKIS
jgi:hypothetical protein